MSVHYSSLPGSSHQRALVIDDDAECGRLLAHVLRREGLDVEVESDGESGLHALEERPPDIALVDVGLPGIDGIDVCRAIWKLRLKPFWLGHRRGKLGDAARIA